MISTSNRVTFPVLVTIMVYKTTSPASVIPSVFPISSAVLTTVILGLGEIVVTVGSSPVSPVPVSPSSEISVISTPLGSIPIAEALFVNPPASTIS